MALTVPFKENPVFVSKSALVVVTQDDMMLEW